MSRYDDIIDFPHHISKNRKPMAMVNRAAQFAPFAALTGYDDAIAEAVRPTTPKPVLSLDEQELLSKYLAYAIEHISDRQSLTFTYFVPDALKDGGSYVTITGVIRRYDEFEKVVILENSEKLVIDNILSISGLMMETL